MLPRLLDPLRLTRDLVQTAVDGTRIPDQAVNNLLLGMIAVRWTQSNSVTYVRDGMTLGVGAGQQSRVDCTRLAGEKADRWARRHGVEPLDGVAFVSDGLIPFRDNIDVAARYGVRYVAEPGSSVRSPEVVAACAEHGIALVHTGVRLFTH